jgi:hypothetical protein
MDALFAYNSGIFILTVVERIIELTSNSYWLLKVVSSLSGIFHVTLQVSVAEFLSSIDFVRLRLCERKLRNGTDILQSQCIDVFVRRLLCDKDESRVRESTAKLLVSLIANMCVVNNPEPILYCRRRQSMMLTFMDKKLIAPSIDDLPSVDEYLNIYNN